MLWPLNPSSVGDAQCYQLQDRCGDKTGRKSGSVSFSWTLFHFTVLTYLILLIFLSLSPLIWSSKQVPEQQAKVVSALSPSVCCWVWCPCELKHYAKDQKSLARKREGEGGLWKWKELYPSLGTIQEGVCCSWIQAWPLLSSSLHLGWEWRKAFYPSLVGLQKVELQKWAQGYLSSWVKTCRTVWEHKLPLFRCGNSWHGETFLQMLGVSPACKWSSSWVSPVLHQQTRKITGTPWQPLGLNVRAAPK